MIDLDVAGQRGITISSIALEPTRADDDTRFRALVEAHFDLVWRTLRRLGVASAELDDAAQQVFIVASRKMGIIEVGGERRYLVGISVRVASDARRTQRRRREVGEEDAVERADDVPAQEDLLDRKRAREMLDRVLETLPGDLRTAFVLFELEGMSAPEVAAVLDVPLGTATSRLRRAREAFHERVEVIAARGGHRG